MYSLVHKAWSHLFSYGYLPRLFHHIVDCPHIITITTCCLDVVAHSSHSNAIATVLLTNWSADCIPEQKPMEEWGIMILDVKELDTTTSLGFECCPERTAWNLAILENLPIVPAEEDDRAVERRSKVKSTVKISLPHMNLFWRMYQSIVPRVTQQQIFNDSLHHIFI